MLAFVLGWLGADRAQAQELKTMNYVTVKNGKAYMVTNSESVLLEKTFTITPELKLTTNGVLKLGGDKEEKLPEGRRITLDGFWWQSDGTLVQFQPHYLLKERKLYLVKSGVFSPVEQNVSFNNGVTLQTDGSIVTSDGRLIRLQDGQMLTTSGQTLAALDHVMMINGKLILQKDGSLIPIAPITAIGMSDGTSVAATGVITKPNGEQITLEEGQRLTLPGPAMSKIP
jgi:hypothetical protein